MLKFMRKIPGGTLLVPMIISALFNTFAPGLFNIGGPTQALFTGEGLNYIIALTCLCSGATLDIKRIGKILRKEGSLLLVKFILNVLLGYLYIKFFGLDGIWGISAVAFVVAICSVNPSLFMALEQDYGTDDDVAAFGLIGLFSVPAYPMLVFGISQQTTIDWGPIISTIIPVVVGIVLGNLDTDLREFFRPALGIMMIFMGWAFGANINLIEALKAGGQGVLLTVMFYIPIALLMVLFEKYVLKDDGVTAMAMSEIAGISVSVPALMAQTNPAITEIMVNSATAQIAFGVVLTSIITPWLTQKIHQASHKND